MAIPMPGPYQVSRTIQDILQRRRDEARQALLDKLEQEQFDVRKSESEAGIEAQRAQTLHNQQMLGLNQAQEKRLGEQALEEQMFKRLEVSQPQPANQMNPELAAYAEKLGAIRQTPDMIPQGVIPFRSTVPEGGVNALAEGAELPTESYDPTIKGQRMFTGIGEVGQAELQRQRLGELLQDEDFQNAPDDSLRAVMAARAGLDPRMLPERDRPLITVSPSGKPTGHEDFLVPPNQRVIQQSWQPPAYFGGAGAFEPEMYQAYDKNGTLLSTTPPMNKAQAAQYQSANPDHILRPLSFQPTQQQGNRVAATLIAKLASAKSKAEAMKQGRIASNSPWWPGMPQPTDAEVAFTKEHESLRSQLDALDPAATELKEIAIDILSDPDNQVINPAQLVQQVTGEDGQPLTPSEQRDLLRLLSR